MNYWLIPLIGISLAAWTFFRKELAASDEKIHNGKADNGGICNTKECLRVASNFLNSMNRSVDPCVDFYEFACGNWEAPKPFPGYGETWNAMKQLTHLALLRLRAEVERETSAEDIPVVKRMKKFYKSCVEFTQLEGIASVRAVLREANGWPMTMSSDMWNKRSTTWQEVDRYYEELSGTNAFFDFDIPDVLSEHAELKIGFSGKLLIVGKILPEILKGLGQLFIEKNGTGVSNEALEKDANDVTKFARKLRRISRDPTGEVSFASIDSFTKWWEDSMPSTGPRGKIAWAMILQRLSNIANHQGTDDTPIRLVDLSYFRQLPELLQSTDERTIVNYIHWNFILERTELSFDEDIETSFMGASSGDPPRWLQCLKLKEPGFAYLFIKKYYGDDRKKAAEELMVNMKKSLEFQITNSDWLSAEAKDAVKEKLRRMEHVLGHEDWYINETALNDYYEGLTIGDDSFRNSLSFEKNKRIELVKLWGKPSIYKQWIWSVLDVNGEYAPGWNMYNAPAGVFQSPLFSDSMPNYVEYGSTGFLMGHEIGHGFDSNEINHGLKPNETLFTDDMIEIYRERAQCFVDVFEHFEEGNGNRTLSENIADWDGVQAALHAYKEVRARKHPNGELKLPGFLGFTDLQMFFLSFAQAWCNVDDESSGDDVHDRHSRRVNGTLSNILAFAEAFNCSRNHPMNPEKKCNMWMKESV